MSRSQNLAKYHDESTKVSRVSVSLTAFNPVSLHFVYFQVGCLSNGFPGIVKSISSGRVIGNSSSGTGIISPSSLYKIGIGHPQYLCLEIPQSRSLKFVSLFPLLFSTSFSIALFFASSMLRPFKKSELINFPSAV